MRSGGLCEQAAGRSCQLTEIVMLQQLVTHVMASRLLPGGGKGTHPAFDAGLSLDCASAIRAQYAWTKDCKGHCTLLGPQIGTRVQNHFGQHGGGTSASRSCSLRNLRSLLSDCLCGFLQEPGDDVAAASDKLEELSGE